MIDMKGSTSTDADIHVLHKEWDEISCPICMDHPHNAVLLVCTSHEKGCRSYICDTSYRHSNCLDRFKKLKPDSEDTAPQPTPSILENSDGERLGPRAASYIPASEFALVGQRMRRNLEEILEDDGFEENNDNQEPDDEESGGGDTAETNCFKCPLCRGSVLSWLIVKEARQYLDLKPRNCSREACSFSGNYRELRRHARSVHPTTRPADVDPSRQRAWRRLEHQREYGDILSAIRSAMPGAIVLGDYVIDNGDGASHDHEGSRPGGGGGPWWTTFFLFHMISSPIGSPDEPRGSFRAWRTHRRPSGGHRNLWGENLLGLQDDVDDDDENLDDDITIPRRRRRIMRPRPDDEEQP